LSSQRSGGTVWVVKDWARYARRRWMDRSVPLARVRVGLRQALLRLTDGGGWVAPGVLGCANTRTDRAVSALSGGGVRLLVNLHQRPHDPDRLERHGLKEVHLPVRDFAAPSPE
jgi:hypothetical protein